MAQHGRSMAVGREPRGRTLAAQRGPRRRRGRSRARSPTLWAGSGGVMQEGAGGRGADLAPGCGDPARGSRGPLAMATWPHTGRIRPAGGREHREETD
jgi:hypothetical protein